MKIDKSQSGMQRPFILVFYERVQGRVKIWHVFIHLKKIFEECSVKAGSVAC